MPAGRLDVVFASTRPTLAVENDERAVDPELHLGGIASWHLPMPAGLEAVISAGVYGTIVSHAYTIESEVALPASRLRLSWSAGIAWSPL